MRQISYTLLPDVAGSFVERKASLDDFARDLHWVLVYKRIPPFDILNQAFVSGESPREAEWEPFHITQLEYELLVEALCKNEAERYQVAASPEHITTFSAWSAWVSNQV